MMKAGVVMAAVAVLIAGWAPAQDKAEAMPEMTTYYFGMLVKGDNWTAAGAELLGRVELQKQHLAHMANMHKLGRLVIAGPMLDDGTIRGLVVYKAASLEEARAWADADPAVKAGRLKIEMHPWMVQKGILREPQELAAK
jgi:uncharacterized protein YciI